MDLPSLNTVLGQADKEGLGGLSETNPEMRVRSNLELNTLFPTRCL